MDGLNMKKPHLIRVYYSKNAMMHDFGLPYFNISLCLRPTNKFILFNLLGFHFGIGQHIILIKMPLINKRLTYEYNQ